MDYQSILTEASVTVTLYGGPDDLDFVQLILTHENERGAMLSVDVAPTMWPRLKIRDKKREMEKNGEYPIFLRLIRENPWAKRGVRFCIRVRC